MAKTITPFNVNSASWTAYTVQTVCRKITVSEVNQAGTVDFLIACPTVDDGPLTRPAGKEFVFELPVGQFLQPGTKPFYIKTASGSVNFDGVEQ